jgi:hypothetical protein
VWLANSGGRGWSCDQCRARPALRRQRGNCGGPFKEGLPLAQRDELGLFVPGYRVAPNCGGGFADLEVRSCPIADQNRMASIIEVYHRHRQGLSSIASSYPRPTCAIIEALDVLHYNSEELALRQREQALQEAQHG